MKKNLSIFKSFHFKSQRGFIALMSSVIISAILLTFLFTTNTSTFYTRFDALDLENKRVATGLAEACVDQALLKLAVDYSYDPTNAVVNIGSNTCTIQSVTPHAPRSGNSTLVTITTLGSYNNTFSNFQTKATVWNPASASFTPPPSCYLWVNTNSIYAGQSVTLGWNSSNATSFKIVAQANSAYTINPASVPSGSQAFTPTASETWVGTVTNSAGTAQCTTPTGYIAPSVILQPAPTCADTVMILDRTGSMASSDLNNEGTAAKSLITLYQGAVPQGQVGIGSFGAYPNASLPSGSASIPTAGQLSLNFAGLTAITNSITGINSSVGSNLADAITVGANELSSARHDTSKAKVLIFVSDGVPNQPSGSTVYDTGFLSPTANAQNATGELWSNPTNAYTSGAGDASDPVSENDKHRFLNFNFPTIPTGATIKGIEAQVDAWATANTTNITFLSDNFGTGSTVTDVPNWDENGSTSGTQAQAPSTGNDTQSPDAGRFALIEGNGGWICRSFDATNLSSLVLKYYWRGDLDAESSDQGVVEYRTSGSCTSSSGWTNLATHTLNTTTWSSLQSINLPAILNNDSSFYIRFRSASNSTNESMRIDGVVATGISTPLLACQLGMDLSYNGGTNFTPSTEKTTTLSGTETTYTFGASNDTWNRTWGVGDFVNSKFVARIHAIDPGANCDNSAVDHVDWLRLKVYYSLPVDPSNAATVSANNAKASGVKIYTIHFGDTSGRNFLASLASGSATNDAGTLTTQAARDLENGDGDNFYISPSSSDMTNIFHDIGVKECPASIPPPIPPTPPPSPPPPPPPPNIIINSWVEQ